MLFYIIFGTNLLTEGPVPVYVFFAYFSVSQKRNIKRSPNGMKPSGELFLEQTWSRGLGVDVKQSMRRPRGRGGAYPLGAPSTLVGPSWLHRPTSSSYIYIYISPYPQTITGIHENLIPPPQPSVPMRSHLGAFSGAPPEGDWSRRASTSTP